MKTKWSVIYLNDLTQLQTWLGDQAEQGWYLKGCHLRSIAVFRREARRYVRYRLEPTDRSVHMDPPKAQLDLYAEAGWAFVTTILGGYDVYATGDPQVQDLFTDTDTLGTALERRIGWAKRAIYSPLAAIATLFFLNFAAQLPFQQPALELLRLDIFGIFLDFVPLWVSCILLMLLGVADLLSAKRQRRQLESEGLDPYRPYPKGLRARFRGLLRSYWFTYGIFAAALIIVVALGAGGSRVTERMPASQLPGAVYASAEELFPGGEEVDAWGYGWRAALSSPCSSSTRSFWTRRAGGARRIPSTTGPAGSGWQRRRWRSGWKSGASNTATGSRSKSRPAGPTRCGS